MHATLIRPVSVLLAAYCLVTALSVHAADEAALTAEAQSLVKRFASELKPQLKQALQEGGPVHAIEVCSSRAPAIASRLSAASGWSIKRVSLKPRNVDSATPDAWERQVLQQFEQDQVAGKAVAEMYQTRTEAGTFRYMKPQGVEPVCLVCHGENLAPAVTEALRQYAPGDTATGYKLGEIRGAFSLRRKF